MTTDERTGVTGRGPRLTRLSTRAGTVVFDCDSTLSAIEGIEALSGGNAEIEALTEAAMTGRAPLDAVYGRRLDLVRPTRAQVAELGDLYIAALVPDAAELFAALHAEGIATAIVSGGLLPAVRAVGRALGVPDRDVAAVDVAFDAQGGYAGFDSASPLAHAGGKCVVLRAWRARLAAPVVLVGDGATDLEAKPAVDAFIAFAGVVENPGVVEAADFVIRTCSLAPVLPLVLGNDPLRSPAAAALYERGLSLLGARASSLPLHNRTVEQ